MENVLIISENRKAKHDYQIIKTYEAGIVLTGSEIKSIRERKVQLKDSFIGIKNQEAYWYKGHISEYKASSYNNHLPERPRKLLLKKNELNQIFGAVEKKGMTCVPLKIYLKKGLAKLEIALVKGKNVVDKRKTIKDREAKREVQRMLKR